MTQRETARNPVPRPCRPGCLPAAELAENRADGGAAHDPARNAPAPEAFGDVPEERRPQPGPERLAVEADLRDEFIAVKVEPGRIDRNFEDSGLNHLPREAGEAAAVAAIRLQAVRRNSPPATCAARAGREAQPLRPQMKPPLFSARTGCRRRSRPAPPALPAKAPPPKRSAVTGAAPGPAPQAADAARIHRPDNALPAPEPPEAAGRMYIQHGRRPFMIRG